MAFYQQQPFYNPRIPFSGQIQGGLQDGKAIIISGRVLPGANRFHVNLQCGSHSGADIALHFNPRYESPGYVVHNTCQSRCWGSEERKYESPFPQGQPFTLQILVEQDKYKISTNGRHFMDFRHRIPYTQVDTISVDGMVELNSIAFQNPAPYLPPQPAFPVSTITLYLVIYHLKQGISLSMLYLQDVGSRHTHLHPTIITFNLRHRSGIAFHYNPRFDEKVVVRNTNHMEQWGTEDRSGGLPFQRGQPFQVAISCNPHHYNVFVNGKQAHTYKHRFTMLNDIDILEICGDLQLTLVQA
ncbi:hypothetical protein cypCar_00034678 [Cyprinus carpio]|nr:hypothetical protein cypCar_00034678 [Cyprinus carpio]